MYIVFKNVSFWLHLSSHTSHCWDSLIEPPPQQQANQTYHTAQTSYHRVFIHQLSFPVRLLVDRCYIHIISHSYFLHFTRLRLYSYFIYKMTRKKKVSLFNALEPTLYKIILCYKLIIKLEPYIIQSMSTLVLDISCQNRHAL